MRPDRNAHVLQDAVVLLDRAVVDRNAGIVDGLVDHAERIGLRRPLEIVERLGPVALAGGVDLVDRDHLARLGLGQQLLVVEAPPGRGVAAEGLAGIAGIGRRPGLHVHDAHFEDVAGLGIPDEDRTGADMDAEALARAAAQQLAVDRTGAAPVHALLVLGPQEHAFRTRVALDHALGVVVGVMGERLDRHVVAAVDLDDRLQELAEVTPVDGVGRRRNIVMAGLALPRDGGLGRRRSDQATARRDERRRAAARHESALEEAPPFVVEFVEQLLAVEFEIRTILVVASAHRTIPLALRAVLAKQRATGVPISTTDMRL